jgi:pullulanase/glycogen debranching enzyme
MPEVTWFAPEGGIMTSGRWHERQRHSLGLRLAAGDAVLLLLLNGGPRDQQFHLPPATRDQGWRILLDTGDQDPPPRSIDGQVIVPAGGLLLLEPLGER